MSSSGPATGHREDRPNGGEGREPDAAGSEGQEAHGERSTRDEPDSGEGSAGGGRDTGADVAPGERSADPDPAEGAYASADLTPSAGDAAPFDDARPSGPGDEAHPGGPGEDEDPAERAPAKHAMTSGPRTTDAEPLPAPPPAAAGPLTDPEMSSPWRPPGNRRAGPPLRAGRGPRPSRPQPQGRLVVERLRHVSPWSVLKIAVIFYICLSLVFLVTTFFMWRFARSSGLVGDLEGFVTQLFTYGECVPEDDLELGQDAEPHDECPEGQLLVGGFEIDDGALLRAVFMSSGILTVAATVGTVFMVLLFNLLSDVTGGVRYSVVREPMGASPPPGSRSTRSRPGR